MKWFSFGKETGIASIERKGFGMNTFAANQAENSSSSSPKQVLKDISSSKILDSAAFMKESMITLTA